MTMADVWDARSTASRASCSARSGEPRRAGIRATTEARAHLWVEVVRTCSAVDFVKVRLGLVIALLLLEQMREPTYD